MEGLLGALPRLSGPRLDLPGSTTSTCEEALDFADPDGPGSCSTVWGGAAREGDLWVSGEGQGVLAVSGSLTLASDARFRGWLWVGGDLRIASGAEFRGLVDVGDRFIVAPGGSFQPDDCAGALALAARPELRRPVRVGPHSWPLFRP
jgi:hypothetical protein